MAGIYIHVPFCRQKCHYCNFFSLASKKYIKGFEKFLITELALQRDYLSGSEITSIYFGGGTPSLMDSYGLKLIIDEISKCFVLSPDAEITLEANPDDLNLNYLKSLYSSGINRLSIGIQSFHNADLTWLNRVHSSEQAESCIKMAYESGISNLSIDLIYGIPGLTTAKWDYNLSKLEQFNIKHFSAYWLTVESKTALDQLIRKKKVEEPAESLGIEHFHLLKQWAKEHDFDHYEISNFCKTGFQARHNTAYWTGQSYLGLGPSAHSYNGISRQWNVANLEQYRSEISSGNLQFEKEILTEVQFYNEYVMTSLRTNKGCDSGSIRERFGDKYYHQFVDLAGFYYSEGLLESHNGIYFLTEQGMLLADHITTDLFQTDDNNED